MSDLLCITVLGVEYVAKESPGCENGSRIIIQKEIFEEAREEK